VDHGRKRHRLKTSEPCGPRVSQACTTCSNDHLKCSDDKPCKRCVTKKLVCQWPGESVATTATKAVATENIALESYNHHHHFRVQEDYSGYIQLEVSPITPDGNSVDTSSLDALVPAFPDPITNILATPVWTPRGFPEFGFATSVDLNDLDLSFLESYNTEIPFDYREAPSGQSISLPDQESQSKTAAFRNSHWHFRPNSKDHVAAEQHNLSLHPTSNHVLPETRISISKRATEKLTASSRDKVLAMVLERCRPENISKAVASFPSVELLDVLLQYCLTSPVSQVDVFLHLPTFNPNKKRPELLAAVIAYGAVLTGDPALTKLGLAIQECVRTSAVSLVVFSVAMLQRANLVSGTRTIPMSATSKSVRPFSLHWKLASGAGTAERWKLRKVCCSPS
jgi:hypothetical protein